MDELNDNEETNNEDIDLISLRAPIKHFGEYNDVKTEPARLFNMEVPIDVPFEDSYHEYFQGELLKPKFPIGHETVGTWESIKQGFNAVNEFSLWANNQTSEDNPLYDTVPPNWKSTDDTDAYNGIDDIWKGYLTDATSPKDLKRRQYKALEWQQNAKRYEDGSMIGHIIGIGAGGITTPSSWLPIGLQLKSARLGEKLIENLPRIFPSLGLGAALHEGVVETNRINGNLEDFVTNTFRDTIFSVAFMGGAIGLNHVYNGGKLWDVRKIIDLNSKNIDIKPIVAPDGEIIGAKAVSTSASAAEVNYAQEFANSAMVKSGMFGVPVIGGWLGKGAETINPIIRGLNSPFPAVNAYWDRSASHGILTVGNLKGLASPDRVEDKIEMLKGQNRQFMDWLKGAHYERNGIDPNSRLKAGMQEAHLKWKEDGYVSEEKIHG